MKYNIIKISVLILIVILTVFSLSNFVDAASKATINCSSTVKLNEEFTVKLNLPSGATGVQANVTVTFKDGSKKTDKIVYMNDKDLNFTSDSPAKIVATVAGSATISVTNILITSGSEEIESNGTLTTTITVEDPNTSVVNNTTPPQTTTDNTDTSSNNNPTTSAPKFKDVNETVYTTERSNIRKSYSKESAILGTVNKGTALKRTGIGDNDWSRVEYNGQTAYVLSELLTTKTTNTNASDNAEVTFKDVNDTMYAKDKCNVREGYSTETNILGGLSKDEEVTRTGVGSNGWSRIKYNGKTAYVLTRLLTSNKPAKDDTNTTVSNSVENTVNSNTVVNEVVQENVLSDEEKLNIIKEEVGVLPEVGINSATVLYIIITIITLIVSCRIIYKYKEND